MTKRKRKRKTKKKKDGKDKKDDKDGKDKDGKDEKKTDAAPSNSTATVADPKFANLTTSEVSQEPNATRTKDGVTLNTEVTKTNMSV